MRNERNPLENIPSSRGGSKERNVKNESEYKDIVDMELEDATDTHEEKYVRKTNIDLDGREFPQMHSSLDAIPDTGLLPDQFEDAEDEDDMEREAFIEGYNAKKENEKREKKNEKFFYKKTG